MVWCSISFAGIVGPLFVDDKVDAERFWQIPFTKSLEFCMTIFSASLTSLLTTLIAGTH
jgi:hypothetical protein